MTACCSDLFSTILDLFSSTLGKLIEQEEEFQVNFITYFLIIPLFDGFDRELRTCMILI